MRSESDAPSEPSSGRRPQERRWPAGDRRRRGGRWGHTYAALDLGTNNCRLLVAKPTRDGFRVIDAFSRIVRLGEGVGVTGRLSNDAMARTISALKICARKMRRRGVTLSRNVATQACRQAENCDEFLDRVHCETGLQLDIISSGEEARLAVDGCAPLLDPAARQALVFDIGGGSTELTWLRVPHGGRVEVIAWMSLPCGVVTLAERYGGIDVSADLYERMVGEVRTVLQRFDDEHGLGGVLARDRVQMLGTSGTVTTLAGVHLGLPRYDRSRVDGLWLSFDHAFDVSERIRAMSYDARAANPCIGRERADLVVAGCAILAAICRTWPVGRLRVADRGVREGLLLAMMQAADNGMAATAAD